MFLPGNLEVTITLPRKEKQNHPGNWHQKSMIWLCSRCYDTPSQYTCDFTEQQIKTCSFKSFQCMYSLCTYSSIIWHSPISLSKFLLISKPGANFFLLRSKTSLMRVLKGNVYHYFVQVPGSMVRANQSVPKNKQTNKNLFYIPVYAEATKSQFHLFSIGIVMRIWEGKSRIIPRKIPVYLWFFLSSKSRCPFKPVFYVYVYLCTL